MEAKARAEAQEGGERVRPQQRVRGCFSKLFSWRKNSQKRVSKATRTAHPLMNRFRARLVFTHHLRPRQNPQAVSPSVHQSVYYNFVGHLQFNWIALAC
eukprot:702050-Prorocentrum_minimum.AAC.1